jgi:uncharacterized protein (DUF2235 family)
LIFQHICSAAPAQDIVQMPTARTKRSLQPKRIILLLDGTWNDADFSDTDTNIVRLRDAIARSLQVSQATVASGVSNRVTSYAFGKRDNVVFYQRGVGTSAFLDRWFGGAFGEGLPNNIRRAYKFLSFYYNEGDQIFIFGFSRGAYTARSLVGYIHAAGLLRRDECNAALEQTSWDFYRIAPNDRLPGVWASLTPYVHDREKLRIACLGLFDTVGALGIPLSVFRIANRDKYQFHDVELSSITDQNLHALAIDELREPFEATVWRRSKFKQVNTQTEQVWFPGAHADIGGGYFAEDKRLTPDVSSLDDLTLSWMIKRLKARYEDFPIDDIKVTSAESGSDAALDKARREASLSPQHNPRQGIYRLMPRALRSIANVPVVTRSFPLLKGFSEVNVSRDRHATVHREMVHISAIERLGKQVRIEKRQATYAPQNLVTVLPNIRSGLIADNEHVPISTVDWNGRQIEVGSPRAGIVAKLVDDVQRNPSLRNHQAFATAGRGT